LGLGLGLRLGLGLGLGLGARIQVRIRARARARARVKDWVRPHGAHRRSLLMRAQPAGEPRSESVASSSLATAARVSPMARSARTSSRPASCAASKAAWAGAGARVRARGRGRGRVRPRPRPSPSPSPSPNKAAWVSSSKTRRSRPCPDRRCRAALTFHRAGQSSTHTAPRPPLVAASSRIVRRT
jgi:hypothetical protein